ncbi:MAG: YbhB/YbcL family Raf kinase inhibitor-like protein [Nitrosotalea sp.]
MRSLTYVIVFAAAIFTISFLLVQENVIQPGHDQTFVLSSSAFENNGTIPSQYTCDGGSISPPLTISGVPQTAKSLALTVVDVDAPRGPFTHWTMWNISTNNIMFSAGEDIMFPQGVTSAGTHGYKGPCPPSGTHRYFFTLYALDTSLNLDQNTTRSDLEQAMNVHVIDKTELMGRYSRS